MHLAACEESGGLVAVRVSPAQSIRLGTRPRFAHRGRAASGPLPRGRARWPGIVPSIRRHILHGVRPRSREAVVLRTCYHVLNVGSFPLALVEHKVVSCNVIILPLVP